MNRWMCGVVVFFAVAATITAQPAPVPLGRDGDPPSATRCESPEERLRELKINLPSPPAPVGAYKAPAA